jgi:hypothetical protein
LLAGWSKRGSNSLTFASEFENEPAQEREVDEPQAIIVAVAARNCEGVLCLIRVLGKQRVDSVYEDGRCAAQKDDRLRPFGDRESSISRVAPIAAIVQNDP